MFWYFHRTVSLTCSIIKVGKAQSLYMGSVQEREVHLSVQWSPNSKFGRCCVFLLSVFTSLLAHYTHCNYGFSQKHSAILWKNRVSCCGMSVYVCVSVWLPPKVVPTTCCLLRFIALSSNDAISARHAKTAGCSPRRGAKGKGRKQRDMYLSHIPMILYTQNKSCIWICSAKSSQNSSVLFRNVRWKALIVKN